MMHVGIDNGLSGGVAVVCGNSAKAAPMPVKKENGIRQVDGAEFRFLGMNLGFLDAEAKITIEMPQTFSPGVMAIRSTWHSFGVLCGVLDSWNVEFDVVSPGEWQSEFWDAGSVESTKAASIQTAMEIWPGLDLRRTIRSRKPCDGLSDALLIAEWSRRNN